MKRAQTYLVGTELNLLVRQTGAIRYLQNLGSVFFPSNSPLLNLTDQLIKWNIDRVTRNIDIEQTQNLSIEDVAFLKKNIDISINRSAVPCSEVFSDQVLFLVIGAIQIQAQTHSEKAWHLVKQSIQSTIEAKKEKYIFQLSIFFSALIICLSTMTFSNTKAHAIRNAPTNFLIEESTASADLVTINMLELAYKKMKSGTCQLPQAAMLPEDQRSAFLKFVNNGVIEVKSVESLSQALGYVNCLYPQELMRPLLPNKI